MKEKSLSMHHPDIADTYYNMGCAYFGIKDLTKALDLCCKALFIYKKTLLSAHPTVVRVINIIDKIERSFQD